jgi:4-oxalocrotonate tautomerase
MPLVEVSLAEGRTAEQISSLLHAVHDAVQRSLGVPSGAVRVLIREVPPTHWLSGGQTLAEKDGL